MQINLTMDTDTNILNTSGCREGGRRGGGLRSGLDIGSIYPSYYLIYCVKPYTLHTQYAYTGSFINLVVGI